MNYLRLLAFFVIGQVLAVYFNFMYYGYDAVQYGQGFMFGGVLLAFVSVYGTVVLDSMGGDSHV